MKTYLECIPCFIKQALNVCEHIDADEKTREKIVRRVLKRLSSIDLDKKPPEFAFYVYNTIEKVSPNIDFYKKIKQKDNLAALEALAKTKEIVEKAKDPLKAAAKAAIAGNIMDFAHHNNYNILETVSRSVDEKLSIDHYAKLLAELKQASRIAYLADNAGEIVLDRLFIEEIRKITQAEVNFFVRNKPIVNDATIEDAEQAGINKVANLKINKIRTTFPFTSNPSFVKFLKDQDVIISKGQANYECLSELKANIFFLLITKCPVITDHIKVKKGTFIIKNNLL
ncbi:DUF89 family protein [Candidatus Woesearchaeota archaeon]|nr:DUF89 family protein [Candidatus Woesearchaeota archaeon]